MTTNPKFIPELQALRGIAALIVIWRHTASSVVAGQPIDYVASFINADAAVVFFFLLSGAVLGMSLEGKITGPTSLPGYFLRRGFRILPLLWLAAILSGLWMLVGHNAVFTQLGTDWFRSVYSQAVTPKSFVASLVGYSNSTNPALWSIFVELIGSILIPLFLLMPKRILVNASFGAAFIAAALIFDGMSRHNWVVFVINFYAGTMIAVYRVEIASALQSKLTLPFAFLIAALGFLFARRLLGDGAITNVVELLAFMPVVAALVAGHRSRLLQAPTLVWVGDVSYSMYLMHWPIIGVCLSTFVTIFGIDALAANSNMTWLAQILTVTGVTLAVSSVTYRFVELGGVSLGKTVTSSSR